MRVDISTVQVWWIPSVFTNAKSIMHNQMDEGVFRGAGKNNYGNFRCNGMWKGNEYHCYLWKSSYICKSYINWLEVLLGSDIEIMQEHKEN